MPLDPTDPNVERLQKQVDRLARLNLTMAQRLVALEQAHEAGPPADAVAAFGAALDQTDANLTQAEQALPPAA